MLSLYSFNHVIDRIIYSIQLNYTTIFKISSKMKLEESQTIAKKLNLNLIKDNGKKKTKMELIDDINKILKIDK